MNRPIALMFGVAAAMLQAPAAFAGPCSKQIDQVQSQLDAKLEAAAAKGPTAKETTAATLHHQPTPATIGAAESQLGDMSAETQRKAEDALARAREANAAGSKARCERALEEARHAIGG